jgi:hypothetical protein
MADEVRTCVECQGSMSPIVIMDLAPGLARRAVAGSLTYRLPEDRVSFWTGQYPTTGVVRAFMCAGCARIALYGCAADPESDSAADSGA